MFSAGPGVVWTHERYTLFERSFLEKVGCSTRAGAEIAPPPGASARRVSRRARATVALHRTRSLQPSHALSIAWRTRPQTRTRREATASAAAGPPEKRGSVARAGAVLSCLHGVSVERVLSASESVGEGPRLALERVSLPPSSQSRFISALASSTGPFGRLSSASLLLLAPICTPGTRTSGSGNDLQL